MNLVINIIEGFLKFKIKFTYLIEYCTILES